MITIHEVSDLHLHPMRELVPFPGGDVLLLAGDIVEYHELSDSLTRSKFDVFCAEASQKYSKVFAILGNHEMYGTHRDNAVQAFKTIYKDFSIQLLNDEAVDLGDVLLYGTPLWTDMNKNDWFCLQSAKNMMDFDYIHYDEGLLFPYITTLWHKNHIQQMTDFLVANPIKPTVIMSHHAPSWASIHSDFEKSSFNGAYASDLSNLILDNSQITHWFHGHTHHPWDYMIGKTRVICNPTGKYTTNGIVEIKV